MHYLLIFYTTMMHHAHNILSIILGSRSVGIAILSGSDIYEWFIKSLPGENAKEKISYLSHIINGYILRYKIDTLALKKFHPSRCSTMLMKLSDTVKSLAHKQRLPVIECSIKYIERNLIDGKTNKQLLTDEVLKIYPVVQHEYDREKKNKNRYLTPLFEAIALGIVCNQISESKRINYKTKSK